MGILLFPKTLHESGFVPEALAVLNPYCQAVSKGSTEGSHVLNGCDLYL